MKNLFVLGLAVLVGLAVDSVATAKEAKEVKSGPQTGAPLGAFNVTKIAGAEDDGVDIGQNLCYRCRNGSRPQVIIFTRSTDPKVAELIKKLDKAVERNADAKLRVFVNLLGDSKEDLSEKAKEFAAKSKVKNVPVVVPDEYENGPDNYGINPKAEVTVTLASDSSVKKSHGFPTAKDLDVNEVLSELKQILH